MTLDLSKHQDPVPKWMQTPEELSRLAVLAQGGDEKAQEDLYWRMRPLVYRLSMKYGGERYNQEQQAEILQEAWVGLADAVQRWDPDHDGGLRFWTVASYRITIAIKHWQSTNSGALGMTRYAWESAWRIQQKLDQAGVVEWEALTDEELKAITGEASAGSILRARQAKQGHLQDNEADEAGPTASAEDVWLGAAEENSMQGLTAWLDQQDPYTLDEESVYWALEALGLAGELEAADVLKAWITMQEDET